MKKLFLWLVAASVAQAVLAGDQDDAAAQRARIAAERGQVEARFRIQEKDCYGRFAVTDCLQAAKARRREAMADLQRQETSLNDADRKRKGAERQRLIEERRREIEDRPAAEKKQKAGNPAEAMAAPRSRQGRTAQQAADRGQAETANAEKARARQRETQQRKDEKEAARLRRAADAAQNVKRREELQAQSEEHKASVSKRLAERKKPPAQPLPVPP